MNKNPCKSEGSVDSSNSKNTYIDPFDLEREVTLVAPDGDGDDDSEPAEFRMRPIAGEVPGYEVDHPGVGDSLKNYIGAEEVHFAAIEYRLAPGEVWLDANDPGRPAWRYEPPLTPTQVADLIRERPDLADVPYAEPLVFLAMNDCWDGFWGQAVAAGWVPTQRDVALLVEARARLDLGPHGEDDQS